MNGFMRFCIGLAALLVAGSVVYQARTYRVYGRYQYVKDGYVFDKVRGKIFHGKDNFLEREGVFIEKFGKDVYRDGIK